MNPKVTIAVAVYNGAEHIERLARTLFEQTLEEMEFLFVDDKSTDGGMTIVQQVLEEYPSRKPQVRYVFHERNLGISATKRDCFLLSRGEYVIVVDDDDFLDRRMAELLYDKAVEEEADMVVSDFYYYTPKPRYVSFVDQDTPKDTEGIRDAILNRYTWPVIWCRLFKRSLFEENDFVWPVKNLGEDVLISAVSAYYAQKIAYVQEPLYHYFFYGDSWSNRASREHCLAQFESYKANVEIMLDFLAEKHVLHQYDRGVFVSKMRTKNKLLPILTDRETARLWIHTFPEAHREAFLGTSYLASTYRERLWVAAIVMGFFPFVRRRLQGRRLVPNRLVRA